jgi:hypothetical protein
MDLWKVREESNNMNNLSKFRYENMCLYDSRGNRCPVYDSIPILEHHIDNTPYRDTPITDKELHNLCSQISSKNLNSSVGEII